MTMGCTVGKYPAALVLYFLCMGLWYPSLAGATVTISNITLEKGDVGETVNISCVVVQVNVTVEWSFQDKQLKGNDRINITTQETKHGKDKDGGDIKSTISTLSILNVTANDSGNYTCKATLGKSFASKSKPLNMSFPVKLVNVTQSPIRENLTDHRNVDMECIFEVYKPGVVRWLKKRNGQEDEDVLLYEDTEPSVIWPKQIISKYAPRVNNTDDSGFYICEAIDKEIDSKDSGEIEVQIITTPRLKIDKAIAINTTQVYLNWSVNAFFSPIKSYSLIMNQVHMNEVHIHPDNTSVVINNLNSSTTYNFMLEVVTEYGRSKHTQQDAVNITTLDKEPIFRPNISINGFSATSVTIGWAPPPEDIEKLIHCYELTARKKGDTNILKSCPTRDSRNLPYMFDNLLPHSTYVFQVQACSDYTHTCGPPSEEMEAATLDGVPGKPDEVNATCGLDYMTLSWKVPKNPNAEIKGYTVEITGNATYKDRYGIEKLATWGPLSKFTTNDSTSIRIIELTPNTHYTARVSAMTRTRRRGEEDIGSCTTHSTLPDAPPRPRWRKINENGTFMFRMYLPRISERNGRICCYRVYMVRIPQSMNFKSLPSSPRDINVGDWEEAHKSPSLISYIADVFSNNNFPSDSELVLGDGNTLFNKSDPIFNQGKCRLCLKRPERHVKPTPVMITTSSSTTPAEELMMVGSDDDDDDDVTTEDPEELLPPKRRRRSYVDGDFSKDSMMKDSADDFVLVNDGGLDSGSNYTLFVELIGADSEESRYSDYTSALKPAASPPVVVPSTAIEIALQITCSVAGLILVLMVGFCVLQSRRSRKMPPHGHIELHNPITAARRYWDSIRGHRQLEPQIPPDIPPIPKEELIQAYTQRQMDSDYGFQKEFELLQMVPEFLTDRTTHASDARENQPKNRYPDIKAYDQTRVKLSQIDSITGSDYINANYVMGYQERKRYICAQGPTDTTVNDFWRMIWEHGLEIIVMLTNLEEYSKVKCSKYWPEERGARAFGNITVQHVVEKRYSDYIVRELKISKQPLNADGQPIVENNGIAKRNGDVKDGSESSAPTSPREVKETGDVRVVRQFHFLMWKDFGAPEHPHSILRFIKRVNEAWANMVGRPVVVHCSAGVGRTGTLVALDSLLEQLRTKGQVSVFNTVAELRTQRNFLVQSLKQYVFVYRALVEYAHYGDTEICASRLKPAVDRLRNTPEGNDKCLMEYEFEKMLTSPIQEPLKSTGAGAGEELRARNRSIEFLPYDRNRVILAPIPGRDFSTYINASFIEAYDNSESFIITQDPLPNTIPDFWRMVSEHNVTTMVMLSELGEGKCPRYWDDGLVEYEHILVQYEESESCPYYTRRTFRVTHEKSGEVSLVRQLQYQGWPTARGHVPEVTRGLAELADAAAQLADAAAQLADAAAPGERHGTMLVHCQFGTERSPLFVALCSLIHQLRLERRVDVSAVARAVRSQRARTIDTFLQYEFLYRAILNYAELHNLLEDS